MNFKILTLISLLTIPSLVNSNVPTPKSAYNFEFITNDTNYGGPDFLDISDFTFNKDSFTNYGFELKMGLQSRFVYGTIYCDVEVDNGLNEHYDKNTTPSLGFSINARDIVPFPKEYRFLINGTIFKGLTTFKVNFAFNSMTSSFSFHLNSYYDTRILLEEPEGRIYYEVTYQNSTITEKYETISILGIDKEMHFDLYRNVPFYDYIFNYRLYDSSKFTNRIFYYVYDKDKLLSKILNLSPTEADNHRGLVLEKFNETDSSFQVRTATQFYLNPKDYTLSKYYKDDHRHKVRTMYFPKEYYDVFYDTTHYFEFEKFGNYRKNVYFKFRIHMEKVFIENCFEVIGENKKVGDEISSEEVILWT